MYFYILLSKIVYSFTSSYHNYRDRVAKCFIRDWTHGTDHNLNGAEGGPFLNSRLLSAHV